MKIWKKGLLYFTAMLCVMTLSSCSAKEYGTKKNPAGVGQTVYYDGMEAKKEKNRFKAEIILEDVVRGDAAQDIFAAAGGYTEQHEALELGDEEELMVARFTFTLTDIQGDTNVDMVERDVNIFRLVSESGVSYDYFPQRRYIDTNLFDRAESGVTQTGALFYIVDKEDENPSIVFMPGVKDGIWFKTSLSEEEKGKTEKPLLASDWLDADGKASVYAGTLNTPLPVGEFGYMKCRSAYFGDYELELKVNDVLRGDAAEEQIYNLKPYVLEEHSLLESQEYMLVNLTANLPSANLIDDDLLIIDSIDFGVINSKSGKDYDFDNILYLRPYDLCSVAPGGTATGWIGVIVDKADASPMMYYLSRDDKMLYFNLDKSYDVPDDFSSYKSSPVFLENPIRDDKQEKGSWKNPYEMGDTVDLNYIPRQDETLAPPFTGNICVKEAYKGELAEKFIDGIYYAPEPDQELITLKIEVNVIEAEGNSAPGFESDCFTILTGQGGEVAAGAVHAYIFRSDGMETVYPGGKAEGYIGFWVPKGIQSFLLTYGSSFTGLDNRAWTALEFSDHISEDIAEELQRQ